MIHGVMKFGHSWVISKDSEKPIDNMVKSGKYIENNDT